MRVWELLFILLMGFQALSVIDGRPSVKGKDSSSDTAYLEVDKFLSSYGYYPSIGRRPDKERNPNLRKHSDAERTKALKLFQEFYRLPQSGKIDKETTQLMQRPRCGNPDFPSSPSIIGARARLAVKAEKDVKENENHDRAESGVIVDRRRRSLKNPMQTSVQRANFLRDDDGNPFIWKKKKMTYRFWNYTTSPITSEEGHIIRQAMARWAQHVEIEFKENIDPTSIFWTDMNIVFHPFPDADSEYDFWRFDLLHWLRSNWVNNKRSKRTMSPARPKRKTDPKKKRKNIAHTVGPPADTFYSFFVGFRDIHFDAHHAWTSKELMSVALHELGHVLGLDHSNDPNAVMYPYNRNNTAFALSDLFGIELLYGAKDKRYMEVMCVNMLKLVDAMFQEPNYKKWGELFYIISGNEVILLSPREGFISHPLLLDYVFPGAPSKYDVVFPDPFQKSVFFIKGMTVYKYKKQENKRKFKRMPTIQLDKLSHPDTPMFAFAIQTEKAIEKFPFIYGMNSMWHFKLSWHDTVIARGYRAHTDIDRQIFANITFAVQWTDGQVYAIKNDSSYAIINVHEKYTSDSTPPLIRRGYPEWMIQLLCHSHATNIRMSSPSLVLVIILSLIKLY